MSTKIINVPNGNNTPTTTAEILIENKIDYTPKVSVIIPVYNVEKYLRQCLDSVVNQTLKEIEIICIDDGSTDSSLEILKEYAQKDPRFTILTQENLYSGIARNAGLSIAKGEYLSFLDSDDWFELNMLKAMYELSIKDNSDIVSCKYTNNEKIKKTKKIKTYTIAPKEHSNDLFLLFEPNPWSKLIKHQLFTLNHLFFENLKRANDLTCVYTLIAVSNKISITNETFIHYRRNQKNNLSAFRLKNIDCFFHAINKLYTNLDKLNLLNTFYNSLVSRMIASFRYETNECTIKQKNNIIMNSQILLPELQKKFTIVSVIICTYNGEEYLAECLDSAINQTLKNIEIICVNDGSTDNSLKILEEYAKKDKRITIINQENQGLSISRNNAINIANGQYLVFLDADDYLKIDALEIIYNQMQKNNLDMLSYSGLNFDNITRKMEINQYWEYTYLPINFKYLKYNYKKCKSFMHRLNVSSCLTAYKKELIENNNIIFPPHLCYEDNVFYLKALTKAKRCGIIRDKLYFRRVHEASITQNRNKHFSDQIKISDLVIEYISNFNKKIYNNYKEKYTSSCVNLYNSFNFDDKEKYQEELKNLLIKHNIKYKITYNHKIEIKRKSIKSLRFITKFLYISRTIEKTIFYFLGFKVTVPNNKYILMRENEKLYAIIDDLSYKYTQLSQRNYHD